MSSDTRDRVREINDLFRTALLNRKYYAARLLFYTRLNRIFELVLAIGTSATIAGWSMWKGTPLATGVWSTVAGVAVIAAVLKPVLNFSREIERFSKLQLGYCSLYYDLDMLVFGLRHTETLTDADWKTFLQVRRRNNDLGIEDEMNPDRKKLLHFQREVLEEIPKGAL